MKELEEEKETLATHLKSAREQFNKQEQRAKLGRGLQDNASAYHYKLKEGLGEIEELA